MRWLGCFDSCGICGGGHHREECPNRAARASERTAPATHFYCEGCRDLFPAGTHSCPDSYTTQEMPALSMADLVEAAS